MASHHRPFAVPLLLLAQMPLLLLVPLIVLALRLQDERVRVFAQLDAQAQSVSVALTSYLQGVEGHLRMLARRVPDGPAQVEAFLRAAEGVQEVTGIDRIRLANAAGDTLLLVHAPGLDATPSQQPFLLAVPVEREAGHQVLTAHIAPHTIRAAIHTAGAPASWEVRITAPDGRTLTEGREAGPGPRLMRARQSRVEGWGTQVSAPASTVYASLWQSAGRELLLVLLAMVLAPPLAWQLVRSLRNGSGSTDNALHELLHDIEIRQQAIARELHDSVGSSLSAIGLLVSSARGYTEEPRSLKILDKAQQQVTRTVQQVRQISRGMMPVGQEVGGLLPALEQWAEEVGAIRGVHCTVSARGCFEDVPAAQGTHLFRIVQEAAGNALRHGHAAHLRILLARAGLRCRLTIVDDGRGCDPAMLLAASRGLGMRSMRTRAEAIGGSLDVLARPGRGVRLRVGWLVPPAGWKDSGVRSVGWFEPATASRQAAS